MCIITCNRHTDCFMCIQVVSNLPFNTPISRVHRYGSFNYSVGLLDTNSMIESVYVFIKCVSVLICKEEQ